MAISDKLTKLTTDITDAYTAVDNKGGTIPTDKNTENLPAAINSITGGTSDFVPIEYLPIIRGSEFVLNTSHSQLISNAGRWGTDTAVTIFSADGFYNNNIKRSIWFVGGFSSTYWDKFFRYRSSIPFIYRFQFYVWLISVNSSYKVPDEIKLGWAQDNVFWNGLCVNEGRPEYITNKPQLVDVSFPYTGPDPIEPRRLYLYPKTIASLAGQPGVPGANYQSWRVAMSPIYITSDAIDPRLGNNSNIAKLLPGYFGFKR